MNRATASPPPGGAARLPILLFHAVAPGPGPCRFPPRLFARGLARLAAAGHRTASVAQVPSWLAAGAGFPRRTLVLTFDDGHRSVYTEALPVLERLGMTATVFVLPPRGGERPHLDGEPLLTAAEIRTLKRAGLEIGLHGGTHRDLTRLPPAGLEEEIVRAKERLEACLGGPVVSFAFPFGRHHAPSRALVERHFAAACTTRLGLVSRRSRPHRLERVESHFLRRERLFALVGTPWLRPYLWLRAGPRAVRTLFRSVPP